MITVKYSKMNTNRQIVWCYLMLLTLMEVVKTKMTEQGNSHDAIQASILDGMSVGYQEFPSAGGTGAGAGTGTGTGTGTGSGSALAFSPATLAFGARPLGAPHSQRVTITNLANRTVHLNSISGNTMHFHSSFFEDKVIPPNGNTSFNVVFLGRERGHVDTSLFIHTSEGIHKYMMSGTSVPSAYRLQPLVGVRLPHNASFSPLIYMHNPHDHYIQITEVYSSGGGVVLELPGGATEGPQALWRLPPHATRPLIAVRYRGPRQPPAAPPQRAHPHVAYVRIKVNGTQSVLVVAVEVFPSTEPGPYTVPHIVDFGMGGTRDPPKQMHVYMGNSGARAVRVVSVGVRGGSALGGPVRAAPTSRLALPPLSPAHTHVATLTLDWREAYETGQCCGKVIIRTKQGQHKIVLPYTSHVLSGGLTYDESVTRYLSSEPGITAQRKLVFKNEYKMGIYLADIVLGKGIESYFEVKDFYPQSIPPNVFFNGFKIRLKNWTDSLKFESKITINTNISAVEIPVYIYNGKLDLSLSVKPPAAKPNSLDLGLVGASSTSRATLALRNDNPAAVCLRGAGVDLPGAALSLLGCAPLPAGLPVSESAASAHNITACTCVPAGWSALYSVAVVAPAREASLRGELWVATAHERLTVPLMLSAALGGRLSQPEPTALHHCFPGTICSRLLRVKSTFPVDMAVTSVEASPPDARLFHAAPRAAILAARTTSDLGWLHYDPYLRCEGLCYSGLDLNTTVGQQWLSRITVPLDTLELDINLVNPRYTMFLNLTAKSPYTNLTVKLDTNQVRNHMLATRIGMTWPRLTRYGSAPLDAPLAQAGRYSLLDIALHNPSRTRPLLVQMLMGWMLNWDHSGLHPGLEPEDCPMSRPCTPVKDRVFHFPSGCPEAFPGGGQGLRWSLEEECNTEVRPAWWSRWLPPHMAPHPDSFMFMLPPGGEKNVTIAFFANYSTRVSSLLYIRNNLTILEVLRLTGQGAVPSLKFGNRKPGSTTPLLFDLTEKHLKDCERDSTRKFSVPPNLTVKRTFVARNTGEIPIRINRFFINSIPCEGYGFKVLNCESFRLLPNGTHKVDIAFTPDFTLTKVERTLIMETSLSGAVNYSLVSSIPASLAGRCAAVLRRPPWEISFRSAVISIITCVGLCVVIAGFYDSDRILKMASMGSFREKGVVHPPLDLRAIGAMGMSKKMETWECCPPPSSLEKKPKESPAIKLSNWNFEDVNFLSDEPKSNRLIHQKYEEVNQITNKGKKKLGKKNSNASEAAATELVAEPEPPPPKEKKAPSKHQNHTPSWKMVFGRNNILSNKSADKQLSQGNSSDSSDTLKLSPRTQEVPHEKDNKLLEVPKKLSTIFNVNSDSQAQTSSAQSHHTNKKHTKTKCHSHQSHSCEEDTSSTTTESSNNDEGDKENDHSTSSSHHSSNKSTSSGGSKKAALSTVSKKGKNPVQYRDSYEGDGEDEEYDHKSQGSQAAQADASQRWTKNRENVSAVVHPKLTQDNIDKQKNIDNNKNVKETNTIETVVPTGKQNKKENSKNNAKKEKQPLSKKRSLDKSFVFGAKSENPTSNTASAVNAARNSPSTPPAIATVWENKASFSDVVARSENCLYPNNFITPQPKDPEPRKIEAKVVLNTPAPVSTPPQTANPSHYVHPEPRKIETQNQSKVNPDLGPIGSNFYVKKSPTLWTESVPDKQIRQYPTPSVPQPIRKPQPQKLPEEINLINNNNSFFLSSTSYFSGNNISDLNPVRNQLAMTGHATSGVTSNSYSPVGASLATNANPGGNSIGLSNTKSPSGIMQPHNVTSSQLDNNMVHSSNPLAVMRDMSPLERNNYRQMPSSAMPGNMLDLGQSSGLLEMASGGRSSSHNDNRQLTGMEAFDSPIPWDSSVTENLSLLGAGNPLAVSSNSESMFDMDYGTRSLYADCKSGWGSTSLWDQSSARGGLASGSSPEAQQPAMHTIHPPSTTSSMIAGDRGPAEWLWGYGGGNTGGTSGGGLGAIGSVPVRPPPGLGPPPQHYQLQQPTQQPQVARAFDPFHSLSSIWAPGPSLDRWGNQQSRDNQDHPGHPHSGHTNHGHSKQYQ